MTVTLLDQMKATPVMFAKYFLLSFRYAFIAGLIVSWNDYTVESSSTSVKAFFGIRILTDTIKHRGN